MSDLLLKAPINYEPKRQNRFLFRFPSDLGIQEWWITTAARPSVTINSTTWNFLNTSVDIPGSYKWQPIQITMNDPIGPSAAQAVMEWLRLHAESATGRMGYAAGYMRDIELVMLDPTGVVIEKWSLVNTFLSNNVGFGSLNYSSTDIANIQITLNYQRALLLY